MRPPLWFGTVERKNGKDRLRLDNPQRFMDLLAGMRGKRFQLVLADYDSKHNASDRKYYYAEIIPAFADYMGYPKEEKAEVHNKIKELMCVDSTKGFKDSEWREYVAGCRRKADALGIVTRDKKHIDMGEL